MAWPLIVTAVVAAAGHVQNARKTADAADAKLTVTGAQVKNLKESQKDITSAGYKDISDLKSTFNLKAKSLLDEVSSGFSDLEQTKKQINKATGTLTTGQYGVTSSDYQTLAFDEVRRQQEENTFSFNKEKRLLEQDLELSRDQIKQELVGLRAERSRLRKQDSFWENLI